MTCAERKAALVEKAVAAAEATGFGVTHDAIEAALTVVLEEAAKVAECAGRYPVGAGDGGTHVIGTADDAASAIRALISEGGE